MSLERIDPRTGKVFVAADDAETIAELWKMIDANTMKYAQERVLMMDRLQFLERQRNAAMRCWQEDAGHAMDEIQRRVNQRMRSDHEQL